LTMDFTRQNHGNPVNHKNLGQMKRCSSILSVLFAIGAGMFLVFDVLWPAVVLDLVLTTYLLLSRWKTRDRGIFVALKGFVLFVLVFLFGLASKVLFFEVYAISSSSMRPGLVPGDVVVVNKMAFGPMLPRSPADVPWVNILLARDKKTDEKKKFPRDGHRRLAGISRIKKGDVLVFVPPWNEDLAFVKRCAGLPGDTVTVSDAVRREPPLEMRSGYLRTIDPTWTIYRFGPLLVPRKGLRIALDDRSYAAYNGIIRDFEGVDVVKTDDGRFLAGEKEIRGHTFGKNYCFMAGDNREDSQDSRYFGFVPEENIIGRADLVLLSLDGKGFRWKRLLKLIANHE